MALTTSTGRNSAIFEPRCVVGRGGNDIKIAVIVDMGVIECCSKGNPEQRCNAKASCDERLHGCSLVALRSEGQPSLSGVRTLYVRTLYGHDVQCSYSY